MTSLRASHGETARSRLATRMSAAMMPTNASLLLTGTDTVTR